MKESLFKRIDENLPLTCDVLFACFLVTEWLCKHTFLSQVVMAAFCAAVLLYAVRQKRLSLHPWFGFLALLIVWALVGTVWALNASTALTMIKTMLVNLVFLFVLYQYLMLRPGRRVQGVFMIAAAVFVLLIVWKSYPDTLSTRFGLEAGVNPNDVAVIAGIAFLFALSRQLGEPGRRIDKNRLWWGLVFIPCFAVLFFASSFKGYALLFGGACIYILLRWPKKWGLKLLGIVLFGCLALYIVAMPNFLVRWPGIYYRITYRIQMAWTYIIGEGDHRVISIKYRTYFLEAGLKAIAARPIRGWGFDCFRFLEGSTGTYSHNNFVELLVSGGAPAFLIYYMPLVTGIIKSLKNKRRTSAENVLLALMLVELPLDFAMVTYYERASLILPAMFFAEAQKNLGVKNAFPALEKYGKNPCRLFAALGSRGKMKLLPDRLFLKLCYRGRMGHKLHLDPPVTMTEKLQWMKLYDRDPRYPLLSDKLAVRGYVSERIGKEHLVPCLGSWGQAEDIDFSALPDRFALKCTHDSGGVRVCKDKAAFDRAEAVQFLNAHLKRNYYYCGREWWYKDVPPRIMAEAFIGDSTGKLPDDYKFFCFDGIVKCLVYCTNRTKAHADYYFLKPDFTLFPVNDVTKAALEKGTMLTKPETLPEMLMLAEKLSKGLSQVRVDLYDCAGKVYFGEMTLCDQSGFADDYVGDGDAIMGAYYTLPEGKR